MKKIIIPALLFLLICSATVLADVSLLQPYVTGDHASGMTFSTNFGLVNPDSSDYNLTFSNYTLRSALGATMQINPIGTVLISHGTSTSPALSVSIPSGQIAGIYTGSLAITATNGTKTTLLSMPVNLSVHDPQLTFDMPSSIALGSSTTSINTSVSTTVTVTNSGDYPLTGLIAQLSATNPQYRLQLSGSLPSVMSPGQSSQLTLTGYTSGGSGAAQTVGTLAVGSTQISKSAPITITSESGLAVDRISLNDGGLGDSTTDGGSLSVKVRPGDTVDVTVRFVNNFDRSDVNGDIRNIDATVTIQGIDNGDDVSKDFSFDLSAGRTTEKTVSFTVPLTVDEGSYTIAVDASGNDENGNIQEVHSQAYFDVEKPSHDVRITTFTVTPSTVECSRQIALNVGLTNYGANDEDQISYGIRQSDLGMDINQLGISLSNDLSSTDSRYSKRIPFTIPDTVKPGVYSIELTAFNTNDFSAFQTAEVTVNACNPTPTTPAPAQPTTPVYAQPTTPAPVQQPATGLGSNTVLIMLLVGINVILLVAIIAVIMRLMQR